LTPKNAFFVVFQTLAGASEIESGGRFQRMTAAGLSSDFPGADPRAHRGLTAVSGRSFTFLVQRRSCPLGS